MSNKELEEAKKKYRIVYHEYQSLFNRKKKKNNDYFDGGYDDEDEDDDLDYSENDLLTDNRYDDISEPFLVGPEGAIIPVKEYGPTKAAYNFWTAQTNFDINQDIIDIIDEIEGVETLEQFTRYRLRIGIGKLFKPRDVFIQLDKKVFEYLQTLD